MLTRDEKQQLIMKHARENLHDIPYPEDSPEEYLANLEDYIETAPDIELDDAMEDIPLAITHVTAIQLRNGKYQYRAIFNNGSQQTLRKAATRLYNFAFQYEKPAGPGNGIAAHFLYGKKARDLGAGNRVIQQFKIEQA